MLKECLHGLALIESALRSLHSGDSIEESNTEVPTQRLQFLQGTFGISRLAAEAPIPAWLPTSGFVKVVRTEEETSIVCRAESIPKEIQHVSDWLCLKLQGPFDLSAVGILSSILQPLAKARVSVFAISTFDTDYVLIQSSKREVAVAALMHAGHAVE